MKLSILSYALLGCVILFSNQEVNASTKLKFALAAPEKTPWAAYAHEIAEKVSHSTNGGINVRVFPGSQLGNEQDVIRQVAKGRIQMGSFSNTAASLMVPEIALLAAPYLWDSIKQADCALDNHLIPVFQTRFEEKGLKILGWSEVGNMGYAFTSQVSGLADLSGKKLRVAPTKASSITADGFGANSVVLPITEVAAALQTGLVEGADLPGLAFTSLGLSKIARNWVQSNHSHQVGLVLMSTKVWDRLDEQGRDAFENAVVKPEKLRQQVRGAEAALLNKFASEGGTIIKLSDTEVSEWRNRSAQSRQKLIEEIGGDAADIQAQIEKAKQACGV
ncbi:TRAP transporter substrate-binding protein [Sneathiella glossodoripedis]|uniref:TRAP transporter substrate-binding protein n=1 Tax=Sneathiella glossodoripedis TaxID=418853 RepID=UPI0004719DED|nr:TRAP transporter substrate-binding protein DctP [Sneathiella glossodoripedis]